MVSHPVAVGVGSPHGQAHRAADIGGFPPFSSGPARRCHLWLLAGIVVLYGAVISLGGTVAGGVARLVLLGYLVAVAITGWPWVERRRRRILAALAVVVVLASGFALAASSSATRHAIVGGASVVLIAVVLASLGWSLMARGVVDRATVLGVLCGYLLLALAFASVHEFLGAFQPNYLDGTQNPAPVSVLLYFSVITLTTVGFGDITPGTNLARAVTGMEALIGQLYLVSVVAAAIGRSRGRDR